MCVFHVRMALVHMAQNPIKGLLKLKICVRPSQENIVPLSVCRTITWLLDPKMQCMKQLMDSVIYTLKVIECTYKEKPCVYVIHGLCMVTVIC